MGLTSPVEGQTYFLPAGDLGVGRGDDNAIVINHRSISRKHALLQVSSDALVAEDLDSSNGTFVDDTRIGRRVLAQGEVLRFGSVAFRIEVSSSDSAGPPFSDLLSRLANADHSVKLAVGMGAVSVLLLLLTLIVLTARGFPLWTWAMQPFTDAPHIAYEKDLERNLETARTAMQNAQWEGAISSFQWVLERDPINTEARQGSLTALLNRRHQQLTKAAEKALSSKQHLAVIEMLVDFGPGAYYNDKAATLLKEARAEVAKDTLIRAREACTRNEWRRCHNLAAVNLENDPKNLEGLSLISKAERNMQRSNTPYVPWKMPSASIAGGAVASRTMQSMYPDKALRQVAQLYAKGRLEEALSQVLAQEASAARIDLKEFIDEVSEAQARGKDAEESGDLTSALQWWERVLGADAEILPKDQPSAIRREVQELIATEYYRRGQAAFGRKAYVEAHKQWLRGLKVIPDHPKLLSSMTRLENGAEAIFAALIGEDPSLEVCKQLGAIVAATRSTSQVHKAAQERLNECSQ